MFTNTEIISDLRRCSPYEHDATAEFGQLTGLVSVPATLGHTFVVGRAVVLSNSIVLPAAPYDLAA